MENMGTFGFIYNNKEYLIYNKFYSEPESLGADILSFIINANNYGWNVLKDNVLKLKSIYNFNILDEDILKKYVETYNISDSEKLFMDPQYLEREVEGLDWLVEIYNSRLEHWPIDNRFILDSLNCEFGYILNLDYMCLEFYIGNQKRPQINNRFGILNTIDEYYPCKLVGVFKFFNINDESMIEILNRMRYLYINDVEDSSVKLYYRELKLKNINIIF